MQPVEHKRGASFLAEVTARVDGVILDLTGITITSQIRTKSYDPAVEGALITGVSVVIVDAAAGRFNVKADDTSAWTLGLLEWDIRVLQGTVRRLTQTIPISCVHEVTKP